MRQAIVSLGINDILMPKTVSGKYYPLKKHLLNECLLRCMNIAMFIWLFYYPYFTDEKT